MNNGSRLRRESMGWRMLGRLQEFADDLKAGKDVAKLYTRRRVTLNVQPAKHTAKTVKATRQALQASQTLFAQFLGVSPRTVRAWEQGELALNGIAGRFLDEIRHDPNYWRERFRKAVVAK